MGKRIETLLWKLNGEKISPSIRRNVYGWYFVSDHVMTVPNYSNAEGAVLAFLRYRGGRTDELDGRKVSKRGL